MKFLIILFLILFVLMFCFAKVKIIGKKRISVLERVVMCAVASLFLSLVFGLPMLGIYYLAM